jgi:hypothetical protein
MANFFYEGRCLSHLKWFALIIEFLQVLNKEHTSYTLLADRLLPVLVQVLGLKLTAQVKLGEDFWTARYRIAVV